MPRLKSVNSSRKFHGLKPVCICFSESRAEHHVELLARISHEEFILIIKTARNWFNNRRLSIILTTLIKKHSVLNRQQQAHSPQLAAGLSSEYKNCRIPYRARSTAVRQNIPCSLLQGTLQSCQFKKEILHEKFGLNWRFFT